MEVKNHYYIVHGGPVLDIIKEHIASIKKVNAANSAFAKKYGADSYYTGFYSKLSGLLFKNEVPAGWTRPDKRFSSVPKKGTPAFAEWQALPSQTNFCNHLINLLNIPLIISHKSKSGHGSSTIGSFKPVGVLFYDDTNGPFVIYLPDVKEAVKVYRAELKSMYEGETIKITSKQSSWKITDPNLELISETRWNYMVAKHNLEVEEAAEEKKRAKQKARR